MEQYKLLIVYEYLKRNRWNRTHVAKELDVSLRSIRNYVYRLKKLGYDIPINDTKPTYIRRKKCTVCGYYKIEKNGVMSCLACKYFADEKAGEKDETS
jgi:transposase